MLLILTIYWTCRNLSFLRISILGQQVINNKASGESSTGYCWRIARWVLKKTPNTVSKWLEISGKLSQRWNFLNTTGAIDGKHIVLEQPKNSDSYYHNYEGTDTIILMAVVGPKYQFLYQGTIQKKSAPVVGCCPL